MFDKSKRYMLLFNGEIYNFLELKQKLKNKRYVSNSDTEILLYSLIEKGTSALKGLEGMFSFIFYDFKKMNYFLLEIDLALNLCITLFLRKVLYFHPRLNL